MANFTPKKIDLNTINGGQRFELGDSPTTSSVNDPIEASAYAQELSETTQNNFQVLETSTNSFMQSTQQDVTSFKEQVNTEISSINAEVETFKSDTNDNINSFKTEVNQNIDSFKSDVNNEIADLENQIAQGQGTKVTIDGVLQPDLELNTAIVGKSETALNSNNNLVLNGDFLLNTNGQTVYNSGAPYGKETANGWIMVDSSTRTGSVEVLSGGGVKLTATSNGFGFRQAFDFTGAGKTYTLTCKISAVSGNTTPLLIFLRNTDYSANYGTINNGISEAGVFSRTYSIPDTANVPLQVYIAVESTSAFTNTCEYTIDYLKLEEGSVSTAPNGLVTNATNALVAENATNATNATNSEKSNALNRTLYSDLNQATEGGTLFYGNTSSSNQNTAMTSLFAGQVLQGGTEGFADYLAQKAFHYYEEIAEVEVGVTREFVRGKIGDWWQKWQEIPSLVKDWESSDGLSWYRIWSNGFKECGGTLTTNNNSTPLTVALPITFLSATSYTIVTGVYGGKSNQVSCVKIIDDSLTSSSFQVLGTYAAMGATNYYNNKFYYYCRGK